MIGLVFLLAQIIIQITRMIAQIFENIGKLREQGGASSRGQEGSGHALESVSATVLVLLNIWPIILVIWIRSEPLG